MISDMGRAALLNRGSAHVKKMKLLTMTMSTAHTEMMMMFRMS